MPGEYNIYNSLAALTVARVLEVPDKLSFKVLSEYKGVWRRFEVKKGKINDKRFIIISDYAHHPTEIEATLKAAREKFPKKKIWCIFQPHQHQRTFYLFNDFVEIFSEAIQPVQGRPILNKLIITDIYDVAGRERSNIKKEVNSEKLIKKIGKSQAIYLKKEEIKNYLKRNLRGGEVVIVMGAGDIYNLGEQWRV